MLSSSNSGMARTTLNWNTDARIATEFRAATKQYSGKMGYCLTAAVLMFLEADPRKQSEFIKRAFEAQLKDDVDALLNEIRETQRQQVNHGDKK